MWSIRDGRFEYRGGHDARTLPVASFHSSDGPFWNRRGLRGFVGVDFIWDSATRHANRSRNQPAADDFVRRAQPAAASRPAGRAWLEACGRRRGDGQILDRLGRTIQRQPRLSFNACGEFPCKQDGGSWHDVSAPLPESPPWIALDIGGANIKVAHCGGPGADRAVRSVEAARRAAPVCSPP